MNEVVACKTCGLLQRAEKLAPGEGFPIVWVVPLIAAVAIPVEPN
jgi:hypothetical protein